MDFRLDPIKDHDGDGQAELIGGFSQIFDSGGEYASIPVTIDWENKTAKYRIRALLPNAPVREVIIHKFHEDKALAASVPWHQQTHSTILRDTKSRMKINGYGAANFTVASVSSFRSPTGIGALMLAGVFGADRKEQPRLEVLAWLVDLSTPGDVALSACGGDIGPASQPVLGRTGRHFLRAKYKQAGISEC
jgi:hypothetical protein